MIRKSLEEIGGFRSIGVDGDGIIRAGNGVYEQAQALGLKIRIVEAKPEELIAVRRNDLKGQKAVRAALFDNRTNELSEWDSAQLGPLDEAGLLEGLDMGEFLREAAPAIDELPTPRMDRAAELQRKWKTGRGQIWDIPSRSRAGETHRLMCGDSYVPEEIDRLLAGKIPGLLHIDPPYGISIISIKGSIGGSKPFGSNSHHIGSVQAGPKSKNQIIQSNIYPVIEGDDRAFNPAPFLKLSPVSVFWGANYFADKLPNSSRWFCWDKREAITRNTFADCELAWCSLPGNALVFHHLWNGLHKGSQNGEVRTHPTEKPVALFAEIGQLICPGGLWLDLFAGTGAQMVAAEKSRAICYACEIEPLYVATILERLSDLGLKPTLISSRS